MSMRVRNKGLQSAQHALRPWLHPKSELTSLQEARIVSVANPLPSFIGFGAPPFLVQVGLWLLLVYFFHPSFCILEAYEWFTYHDAFATSK